MSRLELDLLRLQSRRDLAHESTAGLFWARVWGMVLAAVVFGGWVLAMILLG